MTEEGIRELPAEPANSPLPPGTDRARRSEGSTTATARFRRLLGGGAGPAQSRRSSVVMPGELAGRSGSGRRGTRSELANQPVGEEPVLNLDVFAPLRKDYMHLVDYQDFPD